MTEKLQVRFFKDGVENFVEILEEKNVAYEKVRLFPPGTIVNAGETIEIIKAIAGLSIAPSVAMVIVQWLKNKASRKVILQTADNQIIHLEGYSVEEVESFVKDAVNITIIQTEKD